MNKKKDGINFKEIKSAVKSSFICKSFFSKFRGLMFRSKNFKTPLLFVFDKPGKYPIHSFFCRKFIAIWILKGRIIEAKLIRPWKFAITPKKKFDVLLEIPA